MRSGNFESRYRWIDLMVKIAQDGTELELGKNTIIWDPRTSRTRKKIHRAHW